MLLRLTCTPADWRRVASALDATNVGTLASIVRTLLASAASEQTGGAVALAFTPAQTGHIQRVAAGLGLSLPATLATLESETATSEWIAPPAERAEAVAAAMAIIRVHQRRQVTS